MPNTCTYHPSQAAQWHCPKCAGGFCNACIEKREKAPHLIGEFLYFCPKCNVHVAWAGVGSVLPPFWSALPRIFAYPLSLAPIVLLVILAGINMVFAKPGLFSTLIRGVTLLVVIKYSFEVLKTTIKGNLKPPALNSQAISDNFGQVFKQFAIYILIGFLSAFVAIKVSPILGVLVYLAALLLVPAMIILLVTTESLIHALNPIWFISLAYRIGWGYVGMAFFLFLLAAAPAYAGRYIIQWLPLHLQMPLFNLAQGFYTIVAYHLMGYVILQYHEAVGYKVNYEDFVDPTQSTVVDRNSDPQMALLRETGQLVQDGKVSVAIDKIEAFAKQTAIINLELAEQYYKLLKLTGGDQKLLRCGIRYLDLLIEGNHQKEADAVMTECRGIDRNFIPSAAVLYRMGGWQYGAGKTKSALAAYQQLVKKYPEDPLAAHAYFRAAQIFHDGLLRPEKAKKILTGLLRKYPDHQIVPKAERYLAHLPQSA